MFLENDYARPLFDFDKGGKPRAYQCLVKVENQQKKFCELLRDGNICGKITRTERGMRMHLKTVHDWEEQACLYSTDRQTPHGSQESRKALRAGLPRFPESEPAIENHTEKILSSQKSQETKEEESLKLTREEK